MKAKVILSLLIAMALFLTACGNRYIRNYQGNKLPKTKTCAVTSLLEDDASAKEKIEEIKKEGFHLIGKSPRTNFGGPSNQKKIIKACRVVGADLAFYAEDTAYFFKKD